jgi:hypothetical protein
MMVWILGFVVCLGAASLGRADVVYDSASNGTVTNIWGGASPVVQGNTFQNSLGVLARVTSITVYLMRTSNATGNIQVSLFNTTGSAGNYAKGGTSYGVSTNSLDASTIASTLTAYTFNFDPATTTAMAINGVFCFEISGVTTDSNNPVQTRFGSAGTGTTNMNRIFNGGASSGNLIAGVVNASAVPEPGTLLLGGIAAACGGGGVWWKRRKRKAVEGERVAGEAVV